MPASVHLCYAIIIVNYAISKRADNVLNLFYTVSNFLTHINKKPAAFAAGRLNIFILRKQTRLHRIILRQNCNR